MARIRTIKPEFFDHVGLFDAEQETGLPLRLAYIGLWTQADREGRFIYEPRRLKARILPFDDVDFLRVLDALTTRGFIQTYEIAEKKYAFIPSWHDHQSINNKEKESSLPSPPCDDVSTDQQKGTYAIATREPRVDDAYPDSLRSTQGERERKGKEQVPDSTREAREVVVLSDEIRQVFDHYRTHKPKSFPSPHSKMKEWRKVRDRLKDGHSVDDLRQAIDGCFVSAFHMGENPRQRRYDTLELIMRDADHVQQFIDIHDNRGSPVLSERSMKNNRAAESFLKTCEELGIEDDRE